MTTDTKPKLANEECQIGKKKVKIYAIAKGSGMIAPNMGTMLAYIFTDADIATDVLKSLLKKNVESTFNAITVDSDTSTNDMVTIFSTGKADNIKIENILDSKIVNFEKSLHQVMLNLAKQIVLDGEGAKKFVTININKAQNNESAKKIAFSIANSPLIKTAIAGEDPNWGRIIKVIEKGKPVLNYNEKIVKEYMEWEAIEINVDINIGMGNFTAYTCDFTKQYIDINTNYRS